MSTFKEKPPSEDLQSFIRLLFRLGCQRRRVLWWLLNRPYGMTPEQAYEEARSVFTLDSIARAFLGQGGVNRITVALHAWSTRPNDLRSAPGVVRGEIPWAEIGQVADAMWEAGR